MRRLLSFFMALALGAFTLTAEEFTSGGIFVHSAGTGLNHTLISKTTNQVERTVIGKTYRLDTEALEVDTKGTETLALEFSTGLILRVLPESKFSVDAFNQLVVNYEEPPSALKAEYAITTLSVFLGEIEVVAPQVDKNSQCILQTPLANLLLSGGKYAVKANPKYVIVNVLEGSITVMDSANRKSDIVKGQMGLIIPYPGKDGDLMVTQKDISAGETKNLTKSLVELEGLRKDVLFVVIDKKVVGVRLK